VSRCERFGPSILLGREAGQHRDELGEITDRDPFARVGDPPPGTEAVGFINDTPDLYPPEMHSSGYITAYDVTPGTSPVFGFADEWECPV
jgi:hypothetical protein